MYRFKLSLLSVAATAYLAWGAGAAPASPYYATVLADGPTYYWTFDEPSGVAFNYGSGGGGNLAQVGTAVRAASTTTTGGVSLGTAAQYDGSSAGWFYTNATGGGSLQGGAMDSYAIEMWARADQHTGGRYIFEVGLSNLPSVIYNFNPTALELYAVGNGRTGGGGPAALTDGSWHHIVIGYKDNGGSGDTHTFIIDGGAPTTFSNVSNRTFETNQHFIVGADIGGGNRFGGAVDELAVYNLTGSSQAEFDARLSGIAAHRDAAPPGPPLNPMTAYNWRVLKDNPRFYWSFNELAPQGNAVDLVRGQANDELVAYGEAHRQAGASENLFAAAGLDGSGDFFYAAALNDQEMPGAWAVEMWVRADGSLAGNRGDYLMHASGAGGSNNPGFIYDFGDDGVANEIELYHGARTDGGPTIDDNEWHHLVATFYGNGAGFGVADRVDIAMDGVVTTVNRGGFSSGFALDAQLFIGAALSNGANALQGQIDEAAFYDLSGLTEAQVAARTQQIAGHYSLASQPAGTQLRYVEGVTYQIDSGTPPGGGVYADPGQTKLTDGVIGSTGDAATGFASDEWVGWQNDPVITFDLQAAKLLDSVFIDYTVGHRWGIYEPDDVTIEFSLDGSDFLSIPSIVGTDFNSFDPWDAVPPPPIPYSWARRSVVDLGDTMARYVRMTFANDMEWTFLGEVQFVERIPEPATMTLLALGGLGLLLLGRRRRK